MKSRFNLSQIKWRMNRYTSIEPKIQTHNWTNNYSARKVNIYWTYLLKERIVISFINKCVVCAVRWAVSK
jgi:hypothetical protein